MTDLAKVALITGTAIVVCGIPALLSPATVRAWHRWFPRSVVMAWVLTAIDLLWAAWYLWYAPFMVEFSAGRLLTIILTPVAFVLLVSLVDELLAARALGALLLLLPQMVLDAARWHDSNWRFVLTILAYVWVVMGIVLVLSPYRLRHVGNVLTATNGLCRVVGAVCIIGGLCIVLLGLTVYQKVL